MAELANDGAGLMTPTPLSEEALGALQQSLAAEDQAGSTEVLGLREKYLKLHEAHNQLHELHNGTNGRLNELELELKNIKRSKSNSSSSSSSSFVSELSDLEDDHLLGYEENTIPEVRDVSFELFKNRYGEKDGKNCIEVLIAGSNFDEQVRQELGRRGELDENDRKRRVNYDDSDEAIIQRVRIQSPALLWLLCKTLEDPHPNLEWKGQNRTTFYRPFAWFAYVHDKMKDELKKLEERWSSTSSPLAMQKETVEETVTRLKQSLAEDSISKTATVSKEPELTTSTTDDAKHPKHKSLAKRTERGLLQQALVENYHTFLELRCYTDFVEKRILPHTRRHEDPDNPGARTIRYQDLWFLFQPGELIVIHSRRSDSQLGGSPKAEWQIGRCFYRTKPGANTTTGWTQPKYLACQSRKPGNVSDVFRIGYYVLDYNGEEFSRVNRSVTIWFFEGEQEVTSLQIYPLRFHKEHQELKKRFEDNGSKFKEAVDSRHMAYSGWSRPLPNAGPNQPSGPPVNPQNTNAGPMGATFISTYIESNVIVDVKEAIRAVPDSAIRFLGNPVPYPDMHACQDLIEIIRWSDKRRTERLSLVQDRTQTEDAVSRLEEARLLEADPFTKAQKNPTLTTDDLLLFPDRIYAYALRERRFFQAEVRYLRRLQTDTDAFDSLKIDPEHIRIVKAVVDSHFQRKAMEELPEFTTMMDQDLIRGKGRGLVILLHGAPGVGKTATAEAIALWYQRPLFVITSGDLGFTTQGVEQSLSEIFRLAHLWNCILLLDEADVFLSQRETNALQRNALVSVFLRVLEYYNGILFLTTNRVGTLDEAMKSRVHLSLYYPALGRRQTEEITRMNLLRLRNIEEQRAKATGQKKLYVEVDKICKFAEAHWDRHAAHDGQGRWNGRQIRNAVQIAASLAWYDRKTSTDPGAEELPPILDERHFQTVENTMTLFEGYMTKARGGTDTFISEQRSERYDRYKSPGSNNLEGSRSQAAEPDHFGPRGGQGTGGYHPYPNRQRAPQQPEWTHQQMQNMAGPSNPHVAGSPYAGPSPGQPYQQNLTQHHHQAQTGYDGQGQPMNFTPSPSFSTMNTDHRSQMSSGATGSQAYSQNQIPHMNPQNSYMASGMASTPERQQGVSYQTGSAAPRSSHQASNDGFGSIEAGMPPMDQGRSNLPQGQGIQ